MSKRSSLTSLETEGQGNLFNPSFEQENHGPKLAQTGGSGVDKPEHSTPAISVKEQVQAEPVWEVCPDCKTEFRANTDHWRKTFGGYR